MGGSLKTLKWITTKDPGLIGKQRQNKREREDSQVTTTHIKGKVETSIKIIDGFWEQG